MNYIRPFRVGLAFAFVLGSFHAAWALLVALMLAQPLIDFLLRLHFIAPVYVIQPFDVLTASALVGFSALSGFCLGALSRSDGMLSTAPIWI
jgi:hypothetical protein